MDRLKRPPEKKIQPNNDGQAPKKKIKISRIILVLVGAFILYTYVIKPIWFSFKSPLDNFIGDGTDELFIKAMQESVKDGPSDLEGISKSQKVEMGLNPVDGSDSDMDGLTDKEEIETYHSDPLKASTAGDLYSDGYKIAHQMDIDRYYDYDGETEISDKGITFTAASPFDFQATVSNCTESLEKYKKYEKNTKINYDDVYEVYKINNYSNNVLRIDKSEVFTNNKPSDNEKLGIKVFRDNDNDCISDVQITDNDGLLTLTFPESLRASSTYTLFLYNDKGLIANFFTAAQAAFGLAEDSADSISEQAKYKSLITHTPVLCIIFGFKPTVLIAEDATEQQIADTLKMATACFHESQPHMGYKKDMEYDLTINDCKVVPSSVIKARTKLQEAIWGRKFVYLGLMSNKMFFHCYSPLDAYTDMYAAERAEKEAAERKFTSGDRFCFKNFNTTDYTGEKHGICAGYAWLVALIHDQDGIHSLSGEYYSPVFEEGVSYNVDANDADNLTLLDRYVSDYKAYKFMVLSKEEIASKKAAFDGEYLSDDEKEFKKLVSAYWAKYNDELYTINQSLSNFISNKSYDYLSWQTVENMKSTLDKDKLVLWSFPLNNEMGKGHTVNLTGYTTYDCDGVNDTVIFDVYDSNYPNDTFHLKCKKIISSRGDESFTYEYITKLKDKYTASFDFNPSPNEKGPYDTYNDGDELHLFTVTDADLNCLNVKLDIK